MKLTKKIESEIKEFLQTYWDTYMEGDLEKWATFLPDDYKNIGTNEEEIWNSKNEIIDYSKRVIDQMAGKAEMRNKEVQIIPYDPYVMTHELGELFIKTEDGWTFYQNVRLSSLLQKERNGWIVLHQHGSFPDSKTQEGEAFAFDSLRTENIKLQNAVKERTEQLENKNRELEIEGALQRIRAEAVAMKESSDLLDIVVTMRNEFTKLGQEAHYFWHMMWLDDKYEKAMTSGDGSRIGMVMKLPRKIHGEIKKLADWEKSDEPTVIFTMDVEATLDYVHKMGEWGDFQHIDPNMPSDDDIRHIGGLTYVMSRTTHGEIGYSLPGQVSDPPAESIEILERFAGAFDLAHQRFLDLKKTEQQTRDVQIELALEKVRNRTMAMQKSEELPEAANNLFLQVQELGIPAWSAGYCIWTDDNKEATAFMSSEGQIQKPFVLPNVGVGYNFEEPLKKGEIFHVEELGGELIGKHYQFMRTLPIFGEVIDGIIEAGFPLPTFQIFHICYFKYGYVMFITYEKVPEAHQIFQRFSKVFDQTYTRFLDLQKAEAQAREAQIEAALERVRSRSMAMRKSEELLDAGALLYRELSKLGIEHLTTGYMLFDEKAEIGYSYGVNPADGSIRHQPVGMIHTETKVMKDIVSSWKKQEPLLVIELNPEETIKHQTFIAERSTNFPLSAEQLVAISPERLKIHVFNFKQGYLLIVGGILLSTEQQEMVTRFAKVFQQTYTRFLDLQKAEAQAKEAQIENALEKVRSRTMAMQQSDEIGDVALVLYKQLSGLGGELWGTGFAFCKENSDTDEYWFVGKEGIMPYLKIPNTVDPAHKAMYHGWRDQLEILSIAKDGKELEDHYKYLLTVPDVTPIFQGILNAGIAFPTWQKWHAAYYKYGYLLVITTKPYEDEEIFIRFAKVFEQSYTRFLDLQKAEAQAREAQIEAALEKVRSRSLEMQKPEELQEVVAVVAEKMQELGVILDANGVIICTYFPDNKDVVHWMSSPDYKHAGRYLLTYFDHPIFNAAWDSRINGDEYFSESFTVEEKNTFFEYAFAETDYKNFPDEIKEWIFKNDKHALSFAWAANSAILIPSHTGVLPTEEDAEIMKRFARVFEQAYVRFKDLQKAKERARESQIDIALERVRSRTMGMQKSDELAETSVVLFQQINELASETWSCGFCIWQENDQVELWMGADSGGLLPPMLIPYKKEPTHKDIYEASLRNETEYHKIWNGEALDNHYSVLRTIPSVAKAIKVMEDSGLTLPNQQCYYVGFFKHGYLLLIAKEPNDNLVELSKRFANVFDLTYTRFLDLQLKEKQSVELLAEKQRLETTLSDLQATQKQLIHAEKMASLGELTAGIAHEIQNPLNFVNNFSEVSNELVDEMNEELENGDLDEAKAIAADVKQNLEKILHHGKRADSIVKGMLQHSRSSSGEKEPTDINALADEYLRLAYHGLRAKDQSFNATLETDFDESIGKVKVIPQDMGRVILNLITNAFHTVKERSLQTENLDFKPTVSVTTKKVENNIIISVKDNGKGIPDKIKEKIFQPFFTTKATGQGTGLGLSLSYDIVKAHGGELSCSSIVDEGTEFMIRIPMVSL